MAVIVATCELDHILAFEPQVQQREEAIDVERAAAFVAAGFAFSFWVDGRCVCCSGIAGTWAGCGQAWALFSPDAGPCMLAITKFWRRMLDEVIPYKRVQATAVLDFEPANRWLVLLGFEMEAPRMKSYDWLGRDHRQYARVRAA